MEKNRYYEGFLVGLGVGIIAASMAILAIVTILL
jgi:hypothetical protein